MNAVIIYNDVARAAKAKAMFERAAHSADFSMHWTVKPWRLDLLKVPGTAEEALADAADAHLMVLALRHPQLFPAWLQDWLKQWATRRQVQDAALAAWGGGNSDRLSAKVTPDLSKFAKHHGLSFISGDAGSCAHKSALFTRPLRTAARRDDDHALLQGWDAQRIRRRGGVPRGPSRKIHGCGSRAAAH
jgi:hypothetical protein